MCNESTVLSKINQLEQQILIHSILYYRLGCSIWSDDRWNSKAKELQKLVEQNPELFKESVLYEEFKGFSWVSGYDLPLYNPKYEAIAVWLMEEARKKGELL
ncbi:hypothetical protein [uncultured Clostridium sp.]|uniref:DNA ligase LigA-related protein n=1 Tax=uncultured Clostridium sp. TaxID=59620 RepID=UPI0026F397A3|nr:hypothetical protein [uncultured Clostridium sp.]